MCSFAFCVSNEVKWKTVAFAGYFTRLSVTWTVRRRIVEQGCTDFPEVEEPSQNTRHQKGEVKHVSYGGSIKITRLRIRISYPGDLAPGIFAPLM